MSTHRETQRLALQGGQKAVSGIEGKGEPKIGVEEFMSIAIRFGFAEDTLAKLREAAEADAGFTGPFLANYYSDLPESAVRAFERVAREIFGTKYAVGVSSGTGALHSSFVAVGVGPGTEVICPAIGFYATSAAVVQAKGVPIFCDVDTSLNIDPAKIEALVTERTVAIAPTHVMGTVCDMPGVMEMARKHDLKVVEDCAQSCGGTVDGKYVGTFGDIGCFSISAYKIVGGGEGGLVIMNDERLWDRVNTVAECGGLWRPDRFGAPRYEGELFSGTNYRMSELEAAVDVVQLGRMPDVVARFRRVKKRILDALATYSEITPQKLNDADGDVGYFLRFFPESIELGSKIVEALSAEGIGSVMRGNNGAPDWHIYHLMYPITGKGGAVANDCSFDCPRYRERGGDISYARGDCPVADDLYDRGITINLNQWYSDADCDHIALGLNKVLSAYCTKTADAAAWR